MSFQSSNVTDPSPTIEDLLQHCQAPVFQEGLEAQAGEWVYVYQGKDYTPQTWSQSDADSGEYEVDEIVFDKCKIWRCTGKSGTGITEHKKPKEPEDYGCHDTDMDYKNWSCRYVKISSATKCNWLSKRWCDQLKEYTIVWNPQQSKYKWVVRDTRVNNICNNLYSDIGCSSKYNAGTDKKAQIKQWGAPCLTRTPTMIIRSMVERDKYTYLRTHLDMPLEYHTWSTGTAYSYQWQEVTSPADIPGFEQLRRVNAHNPFDGKGYTRTEYETDLTDGFARWDMLATEDIDSIAFGMINCNTVDVRVSDQEGNSLWEINEYPVDNTIAPGRFETYPSTIILYMDQTYPAGVVVTVKLHGSEIVLGEMIGASKLDAGFTNLNFKNTFKDFSPKEQDQWGNWYYTNGVKVKVHTGTVTFPVVSYDKLNRLMLMIGGQKVLVNSSDSTLNEVPDGRKVFEATMLIGRFTKFSLDTKIDKKRIQETGTYTFSLEELV